ncbi:ribonuclease H-like domain-containing protein, partial [Tanacetum coccineum]
MEAVRQKRRQQGFFSNPNLEVYGLVYSSSWFLLVVPAVIPTISSQLKSEIQEMGYIDSIHNARETSALLAPKTAKQLAAKRKQERVKSILFLAIPDEYLLKFHNKFLRSLPSSWNQIALILRNKPDIDEIDIDDLYNNLRVYEDEMKRSSSSTSTSQNLAFLSSENTSSTNEISTASRDFRVSTTGGISQISTTSCAHDVACSFFTQPTTSPQLENEDFQQIDEDDLEELDLRWQSKIECYNCHIKGHFARECISRRNQGRRSYGDNGRSNAPTNEFSSQALVAQDGLGGYDWSNDFEVEPVN